MAAEQAALNAYADKAVTSRVVEDYRKYIRAKYGLGTPDFNRYYF